MRCCWRGAGGPLVCGEVMGLVEGRGVLTFGSCGSGWYRVWLWVSYDRAESAGLNRTTGRFGGMWTVRLGCF